MSNTKQRSDMESLERGSHQLSISSDIQSESDGQANDAIGHNLSVPNEGDSSNIQSPEEIHLRNRRKQLRAKITRSINRLRLSIAGEDKNKRRMAKFMEELKLDYKATLEIHGQLYDFVDPSQIPRLDQWETDLCNDVYAVEESVEDYLVSFTDDVNLNNNTNTTTRVNTRLASKTTGYNLQFQTDNPTSTTLRQDIQSVLSDSGITPQGASHSMAPQPMPVLDERPILDSHVVPSLGNNSIHSIQGTNFDSWIDALVEFQETILPKSIDLTITEALFRLEASRDIPTIKLDKFDGNPLNYVDFIERFKLHIHDKSHLSDDMRMVQLRMHLTGDAERAISGLGANGVMYPTAMKTLKYQFGQKSAIAIACLRKLTDGRKLNDRDKQGLRDFSLDVINCISVLQRISYQSDINSSDSLRLIVRRLPDFLIGKWKNIAADTREKGEIPTIYQVSNLIRKQVSADFDPDFGDIPTGYKVDLSPGKERRKGLHSNQVRSREAQCNFCEKGHVISECAEFKKLKQVERYDFVKKHRICFSCLGRGHTIQECRSRRQCSMEGCSKSHHSLLHLDSVSANRVASVLDRDGILPVVRVRFHAPNGKVRQGNVLIDSGAGTTVIRRDFARTLGLQGKREPLDISVVGGETVAQPKSRRVKFSISPLNGNEEYAVEAHEIDKTILSVPPLNRKWIRSYAHLEDLEFSHQGGPVDLILGVQYSHLHTDKETRQGRPFEPVGKKTPLGWYVIGSDATKRATSVCSIGFMEKIDLDKFYSMETLGIQGPDCNCSLKAMSPDDRKTLELFEKSCEKKGDRFTIGLPWKHDPALLSDNFQLAEKRLVSLERSLSRDHKKAQLYNDAIVEYLENGWAIKLTDEEVKQKPAYYLPHHGVYRPEKKSTPLRVVFDPACEYKGISLNSMLYKGPCLIGNLLGVLIRFREEEIAFMGDISKMYLQICLPESDTYLHRFLWRNLDTTRKPLVYRLLRVTFGDKPSPDMASFVILRIAQEAKENHPDAALILERDRYVDDVIHSCSSYEEASRKMEDLDKILGDGSFRIKKWFCSGERSFDKENKMEDADILTKDVSLHKQDSTKALGIVWGVQEDVIKYEVKRFEPKPLTKRLVLSRISGIFDPLGLVSAVTIKARIALQDIWRLTDMDWDDELPEEIKSEWENIFNELQKLSGVSFPRSLKPNFVTGNPELHVFSDASALAYGAVAYILWPTQNGPEIRLVSAKARVAPLRQTTIPRLELMGALIASRLAKTLCEEFKLDLERVILWSDSQIVLHWVNSDSALLKAFVGVRVAEIQSSWENNWRFVPSGQNPADDLSRGLSVEDLNGRWKTGPDFLRKPEKAWPQTEMFTPQDDIERKKSKVVSAISVCSPIINASDYSSWQRLVRVMAYVNRFCHNVMKPKQEDRYSGALSREEIEHSERYWILQTQTELLDSQAKYRDLAPFVEDGVIRVGGRLGRTSLSYDQVHPILLPSCYISKLIMREVHFKMGHVGPERVLSETRRKFWVMRGRNLAKSIVRECVVCRKLRQPPHLTLMADLPPERMTPFSPPFSVTGVDLFGPFNLRYGRNKSQKAWGAIFTCATVRAIHLEIVDNLSTQAFMQALRRFVAHHGWPSTIISDNGTSFVGTQKELGKLVKEGRRQIEDFASLHKVNWRFITPLSPHQGGLYESLIKQVKQAIKVSIGQQLLSWGEMTTVFSEVECLINSRPLGYSADNPNDPQPLTPNNFLIGRSGIEIPHGPFQETKNLHKRFEYVQALVRRVWDRFIREYVPTLMRRTKWLSKGKQLEKGDIVLLVDFNLPRGKWELAKVTDVYPGHDGVVRNVKVRTKSGEYKRSIQKCCLILNN